VPANDDALRAFRLFASKIADAVTAGRGMRESRIAEDEAARAEEAAAADSAARLTRATRPQRRSEPAPTTAGA
jgi:small subunit ribosomal protein S2